MQGESWGLVWITLVGNTWKLFWLVFFSNKNRKAGASTLISAFSYYQYGLHVKQLEFLVSRRYIKASYVFSNWGEKLGQLGISQV